MTRILYLSGNIYPDFIFGITLSINWGIIFGIIFGMIFGMRFGELIGMITIKGLKVKG